MKVFVSLGERSASNYVYNIFKDIKGIDLYGITDERLESIGFKSVARIEDLSVVGLIEALPKVPYVYRLWKRIEELLPERQIPSLGLGKEAKKPLSNPFNPYAYTIKP